MTSPNPTVRLAPLEPPFDPEVADVLQAMMPPGVPPIALFRLIAHNPRVLHKLRSSNLLDRGALPLRERELIILRTTARCGASYEWGIHVAYFAGKAGFSAAQIAATADAAELTTFDARERLLIELVDMLHDAAGWTDAGYASAAAHWTPAQLIEIVVLAGYYRMISQLVNAFAPAPEPGAPVLPASSP